MTALAGWNNFYLIVGASSAALIGLQFVATTLIANRWALQDQGDAGASYATPTVVHFGAVLLLAGIQTSPSRGWQFSGVCWA